MWDTLEVTHEGTNDVKSARKHALIQEYEMFRMQKGETIVEVQKRFTHIVNHLMSLGKIFEKGGTQHQNHQNHQVPRQILAAQDYDHL